MIYQHTHNVTLIYHNMSVSHAILSPFLLYNDPFKFPKFFIYLYTKNMHTKFMKTMCIVQKSRCMNTASWCPRLHHQYSARTLYKVHGGTIFKMDVHFKNSLTTDIKMVCARCIDSVNVDIAFSVFMQ